NEFNYDENGTAADLFQDNFLSVGQNVSRHPDGPATPIQYPYRYLAPSNTGITSGFDLDNNGTYDDSPGDGGYGNDSFGYGEFPGRYGMLLLSKYPIATEDVRTFQKFLWRDMPGALLPDDAKTAEPNDWYSAAEQGVMRLSSKSHWDVPIRINDQTLHVLASHPTPPVFDGAEDRNGRRNHDEIRIWADYISPEKSGYLQDDAGKQGGLAATDSFVILGDMNADPTRGDSVDGAIKQLTEHPRIKSVVPLGASGSDLTATFNLRVDYVLPSSDLTTVRTEVFWPERTDPLSALLSASDHRMVWADVQVSTVPEPTTCSWSIWLLLLAAHFGVRSRSNRC
ncbi:MAG: endonuclease/exonuclease/phosphatase family protein, partial [Planctomycetales bacterium]|nr:endonuclease/exonuclease/phosphatase family protein [Planctomycetales bacterium]